MVRRKLVGREPELALLHEIFQSDRPRRSVVVWGEPGIGKTTLWEAGIAVAREKGLQVVSARPCGAEAQPFAALVDLSEGLDTGALAGLPAPQRSALERALLRIDAPGVAPEPHAIWLGLLNALRALATAGPLLIAIDGVQWLDPPSARALSFAAWLEPEQVGFFLTRRPGAPCELERVLERCVPARLRLGPLSIDAIRRLLYGRLELSMRRQLLRRVMDATHGNPLLALEVGRELLERGVPRIGEDIPVPDAIEDVLGTRVARLWSESASCCWPSPSVSSCEPPSFRRSPTPPRSTMASTPGCSLEASACARHTRCSPPRPRSARGGARRRELHLALAGAVADEELRARHLALATEHPDSGARGDGRRSRSRGVRAGRRPEAVQLAEQALRLTPPGAGGTQRATARACRYLETAGEPQRVTDLLAPELESLPPGPRAGAPGCCCPTEARVERSGRPGPRALG